MPYQRPPDRAGMITEIHITPDGLITNFDAPTLADCANLDRQLEGARKVVATVRANLLEPNGKP